MNQNLKKSSLIIPFSGLILFGVLTTVAILFYPGGNRFEPAAMGYSFFDNFWCDLLDKITHRGEPNAGRPFAVLANIIFPLSMIPLWIEIPNKYAPSFRLMRATQVFGIGAMFTAALVFSPFHDNMIILNSITLGPALLLLTYFYFKAKKRVLLSLMLVPTILACLNFSFWFLQVNVRFVPAGQKFALFGFLIWVGAAVLDLRRTGFKSSS